MIARDIDYFNRRYIMHCGQTGQGTIDYRVGMSGGCSTCEGAGAGSKTFLSGDEMEGGAILGLQSGTVLGGPKVPRENSRVMASFSSLGAPIGFSPQAITNPNARAQDAPPPSQAPPPPSGAPPPAPAVGRGGAILGHPQKFEDRYMYQNPKFQTQPVVDGKKFSSLGRPNMPMSGKSIKAGDEVFVRDLGNGEPIHKDEYTGAGKEDSEKEEEEYEEDSDTSSSSSEDDLLTREHMETMKGVKRAREYLDGGYCGGKGGPSGATSGSRGATGSFKGSTPNFKGTNSGTKVKPNTPAPPPIPKVKGPVPKGPTPKGPTPKGPTPKGPTPKGPAPKGPTPKGPAPKGPAPKGPAPKGNASKGLKPKNKPNKPPKNQPANPPPKGAPPNPSGPTWLTTANKALDVGLQVLAIVNGFKMFSDDPVGDFMNMYEDELCDDLGQNPKIEDIIQCLKDQDYDDEEIQSLLSLSQGALAEQAGKEVSQSLKQALQERENGNINKNTTCLDAMNEVGDAKEMVSPEQKPVRKATSYFGGYFKDTLDATSHHQTERKVSAQMNSRIGYGPPNEVQIRQTPESMTQKRVAPTASAPRAPPRRGKGRPNEVQIRQTPESMTQKRVAPIASAPRAPPRRGKGRPNEVQIRQTPESMTQTRVAPVVSAPRAPPRRGKGRPNEVQIRQTPESMTQTRVAPVASAPRAPPRRGKGNPNARAPKAPSRGPPKSSAPAPFTPSAPKAPTVRQPRMSTPSAPRAPSMKQPVSVPKAPPRATGTGKPNKRAEIVKKVMSEQGMSMIEASKYVKANGLY